MNVMTWVWIVIGVVAVIAIIIVIVMMSRGRREVHNRERAGELRSRAAEDDQLIDSRQERVETLEEKADAARRTAISESERAEALHRQAGESDEAAARAAQGAEILDDEARHSREDYEKAVEDHDKLLREADRRDPDVSTDKDGNRVEDEPTNGVETDEPVTTDEAADDVPVIPEEERLDIGDDYSADEFAEPDAEYIDPVEHERMAQLKEEPPATEPPAPDETAPVVEERSAPRGRHAAVISSDDVIEADAPAVDAPGARSPQDETTIPAPVQESLEDDIPRDEQGRRLDPYGNPVADVETPETPAPTPEPIHDDIPRDEQGRRLDPYGNPVAEDRDL